jgi:threonyl-tRNA synthetase
VDDLDSTDKTPLCLHRAPLGTHGCFIGFLIEHYTGNFPLWLALEQVRIMTLGEEEPLLAYAKSIAMELWSQMVRVETDFSPDPIKAKNANAEQARAHTMLVIGGRDFDAGNVSVCLHGKGPQGAKPKVAAATDTLASIRERSV